MTRDRPEFPPAGGALRAATVVALVLLAGCSGLFAASTATPTPAPVPTAPDGTVPVPGATEDGVHDPIALAEAHRRTLNGTTFTVRSVERRRAANGTVLWQHTVTRYVDARDRRARSHLVSDVEGSVDRSLFPAHSPFLGMDARHVELYVNGTEVYGLGRNATARGYVRCTTGFEPSSGAFELFGAVRTRATGRVTHNGTTLYRFEGGRLADEVTFANRFVRGPYSGLANVSVEALVDARGAVHEYEVRYTVVRGDGRRARASRTVTFGAFGTTAVDRPDWYDAAVTNTTG